MAKTNGKPPLPDPETLVMGDSSGRCCADPELKQWLDGIKRLRDEGKRTPSYPALVEILSGHGYKISAYTIGEHFRRHVESA